MNKHKARKESWQFLVLDGIKQRWHERSTKCSVVHLQDIEERKKRQAEEQLHYTRIKEEKANEILCRNVKANRTTQEYYAQRPYIEGDSDTAPLLLDAVMTPVSENEPSCSCSTVAVHAVKCKEELYAARKERNQALTLAQHYRNIAEATRTEKREIKKKLEGKVELVRNFWRNNIIEGGSRSGRILRAALIKN